MTKAAFDREMGCHLFLQMLPVEHAGVLLLFINPYDERGAPNILFVVVPWRDGEWCGHDNL